MRSFPLPNRSLTVCLALAVAAATWLPGMHVFFRPHLRSYISSNEGISPKARALAARHLALWSDPDLRRHEIAQMRASNAEWDFMARTFLVLSLANMALREPAQKNDYLGIIDRIIDETIRLEQEHGKHYFLMGYALWGEYVSQAERSLFQDGEIALMLAVRRLVEEKQRYRPLLAERIEAMVGYMRESPVLSGESYPDECWMFCNTIALVAIHIADVLDGSDHASFIDDWLETAKQELIHPETGLLVSSYTFDGAPKDGPEGSTIWMVAHMLQVLDPGFAEQQYRLAKDHLARNVLGLGYACEWPKAWEGWRDVDSGPIVPFLDISPGSSGMALVAASAFGDHTYLASLLTSLNFGGFPIKKDGRLYYGASNQVGDAVMLYAVVLGPLWQEVEQRGERHPPMPVPSIRGGIQ